MYDRSQDGERASLDRPDEHQRTRDTKGRTRLFNRTQDRKDLLPWVLSLALHLGAILLFWNLRMPPVRPPEVMQVMLAPPDRDPTFFSELPADRADKAPDKPDAISNVTSRARDRIPGGNSELPGMRGEGDAPTVRLDRSSAGAPAASAPPSTAAEGMQAAGPKAAQQNGTSLVPVPDRALRGSTGNSETEQPEMKHPEGNAAQLGDVSLNTIEWDYAPWLQRFGSRLMDRWFAPPAYLMGILKEGGFALIEVEISRSGKLLRLDLLDEEGHPSLIRSAQSALRSMAPIEPLPTDFPEPTLILRIRMTYPRTN